jgi:hypothetical protein
LPVQRFGRKRASVRSKLRWERNRWIDPQRIELLLSPDVRVSGVEELAFLKAHVGDLPVPGCLTAAEA